jgi:hypothetical protein
MNRAAVSHQVLARRDILLERRVDVIEVDVGEEAVDTGIDAALKLTMRLQLPNKSTSE